VLWHSSRYCPAVKRHFNLVDGVGVERGKREILFSYRRGGKTVRVVELVNRKAGGIIRVEGGVGSAIKFQVLDEQGACE